MKSKTLTARNFTLSLLIIVNRKNEFQVPLTESVFLHLIWTCFMFSKQSRTKQNIITLDSDTTIDDTRRISKIVLLTEIHRLLALGAVRHFVNKQAGVSLKLYLSLFQRQTVTDRKIVDKVQVCFLPLSLSTFSGLHTTLTAVFVSYRCSAASSYGIMSQVQ